MRRVADLDSTGFDAASTTPSPSDWADEVLYFLMVDRFSDGREDGHRDAAGNAVPGPTPAFVPGDSGNAVGSGSDAAAWRDGLGGAPVLSGAAAVLECECEAAHDTGDHCLFIGRVLRMADLATPPLLFHGGHYHMLGEIL